MKPSPSSVIPLSDGGSQRDLDRALQIWFVFIVFFLMGVLFLCQALWIWVERCKPSPSFCGFCFCVVFAVVVGGTMAFLGLHRWRLVFVALDWWTGGGCGGRWLGVVTPWKRATEEIITEDWCFWHAIGGGCGGRWPGALALWQRAVEEEGGEGMGGEVMLEEGVVVVAEEDGGHSLLALFCSPLSPLDN